MTDGRRTTDGAEHLPHERMAAFLDGRLDALAREAVVAHFASCAECRRELVELRGVLRATRSPRRTLTWLSAAAGVAAVLAIAVLPRAGRRPGRAPESVTDGTRAAAPVAAPAVSVVSPAAEGVVSAGAARLVWRAAGADAMYDVTIQDAEGSVAWSATVADTTVAVPATAALVAGRSYFWSVDARLADGQAVRSEIRSFSVRR